MSEVFNATQISAKAYKVSSVSNGEIVVTDCEGNKLEIESAEIKEDGVTYIKNCQPMIESLRDAYNMVAMENKLMT